MNPIALVRSADPSASASASAGASAGSQIRHRRSSKGRRPSFTVPRKNNVKVLNVATWGHGSCDDGDDEVFIDDDDSEGGRLSESDAGAALLRGRQVCCAMPAARSRDLSPVEQVREMLEDADDIIDEVLERIVTNVASSAEQATAAAATAAKIVQEAASESIHAGKHMVRHARNKSIHAIHNAATAVQSGVHKAEDLAKNAATAVQTGVHKAEDLAKDMVHTGKMQAGELAKKACHMWKACHFQALPSWMKDNEYLLFGHRPEMNSFLECFKSIFRIHTETVNIWSHLLGFIAMVVVTIIFYVKPLCTTCSLDIALGEKLMFLFFFVGALLCLLFSTLFHTVSCHSEWASHVFSRLDYAGIAVLIVGSIIPWLYYGFYCQFYARLTYMTAISVLGVATLIILMWEKFNKPEYRTIRAIVFVSLACSAVVPLVHHFVLHGKQTFVIGAMHWTLTMGALYLTGAFLYACRIPERFYPGKCDIWFQSHQIFHLLVVAAAFVHYNGISEMAIQRLTTTGTYCPLQTNVYH
jgi:adiponectin receptor